MDIPQTKICKGCHMDKPIAEYGKHKQGLYGLRSRCRPCRKLEAAERNSRPEVKVKTLKAKRIWKEKNRELLAKQQRDWYATNPEKARLSSDTWKANNGDRYRRVVKAYADSHKAERASWQNARHAKQLERTPPWVNLRKIKSWYIQANKLGLQVDHTIPLQGKLVSGLHVHNNLQLLTPLENQQKKNKFEVDV